MLQGTLKAYRLPAEDNLSSSGRRRPESGAG
jgi:hypothetical protein